MTWRRLLVMAIAVCAMIATIASTISNTGAFNSHSSTARARSSTALTTLLARPIPVRNLYALTDQLRLHAPHSIPHVIRNFSPNYRVGHQDKFWVLDEDHNHYFVMPATIRAETKHLYLYVQTGVQVNNAVMQRAAINFEKHIYPTDRSFFGSEWRPGVDGDPHITCLIGNLRSSGVGGYYSAEDEYPRLVNPYSNQREMFYINSGEANISDTSSFDLTLSHEFQHMIHWNVHPHENLWLNEGMSMLAERLNHLTPTSEPEAYLSSPTTQLTSWNQSASASVAHYGAAYLFLSYIYDHYGRGVIHDIVSDRRYTDFRLIDDVLQRRHIHTTAIHIFQQWIVANYLNDASVASGVYAYKGLPHTLSAQKTMTVPSSTDASVPPYAPRYIAMPSLQGQKPFRLRFAAPTTMPLIGTTGVESSWWSNRGDMSDTRLVRQVDLRRVHHATLQFQTWYDIEKNYDYAYVEASRDGHTWTPLRATHTTRANPNGASYGWAYTGNSNNWTDEKLDLSAYAGHRMWLRLEYVTDEGYNGQGMLLKNISIPEIGFHDRFTGWKQQGFLPLTSNAVPISWHVQLISYGTSGVQVTSMPISGGHGSVLIDPSHGGVHKVVAVVYGGAPKTTRTAPFQLSTSAQ